MLSVLESLYYNYNIYTRFGVVGPRDYAELIIPYFIIIIKSQLKWLLTYEKITLFC